MFALLLLAGAAAAAESSQKFAFCTAFGCAHLPNGFSACFAGQWDTTKSEVTAQGVQTYNEATSLFSIGNSTDSVLSGYMVDRVLATNETVNRMEIRIECSSATEGTFSIAPEGTDDFKPLFDFNFAAQVPSGLQVSHGVWHGAEGEGRYQFVFLSPEAFLITVVPTQADAPTKLFWGKKIVSNVAKGFLQQYGTYIMVGVMLLMQTFMKRPQPPVAPPQDSQAVRQQAEETLAALQNARVKASVEEIPAGAEASSAESKKSE